MNDLYIEVSCRPHYFANSDDDFCNECNSNALIECCNRCGEGVCANDNCSTIFPHYQNSVFAICRTCYIEIDQRFTLQIDVDKLRTLKKKIYSNRTKRIMNKK